MDGNLIGILIAPIAIAGTALIRAELERAGGPSERRVRAMTMGLSALLVAQSVLAIYLGGNEFIINMFVGLLSLACLISFICAALLPFDKLKNLLAPGTEPK